MTTIVATIAAAVIAVVADVTVAVHQQSVSIISVLPFSPYQFSSTFY